MLVASVLSFALGAAPVQDASAQATPEAVLDELIQRSASIGAFRARYQTEGGESDDKTIVFEYLPKDRLHLVVNSTSGRVMESWIDGSRLCFVGAGEQGEMWAELDWADPAVELPDWHDLLEDRFPLKGEWAVCHPMMLLTWSVNEETDNVDFQCSVGCERGPRSLLCGWLRVLERDPTLLSLTEDAIVQEHARYRATVSRRTGFLESLSMVGKDGKTGTFRLVALELDTDLKTSDFRPPTRPDSAQDVSEPMTYALLTAELNDARLTTFQRVDGLLDRGEIEWSARTQDDLGEVLRAVHDPQMQILAESYGTKVRSKTAEFFTELRDRLAKGEPKSALEPEVAAWRADLVKSLEEGLPALQSRFAPQLEQKGRSEGWDDLLSLEQRVLEQLYGKEVKDPLLADFEAAAESFLRG